MVVAHKGSAHKVFPKKDRRIRRRDKMICGKILADPDEISMEIPDDTIIVPPGSGRAVNFLEGAAL